MTESGTEKVKFWPPLSRIRLLAPPFWNFWICPSIGFTFVSVVSFPSCYYNCIVGVVRVRTKLIFFLERQLLALMYYGRSPDVGLRPLSIVLGSVHTKKGRGWLHGGHCKGSFSSFYWTKPRILCRKVLIVSTDDGTSCWPSVITDRLFGNTSCFVLRTPETRACACQKK